ncbi:recombination directionality factor [Streptomyces spiralis]|uniref:recombination directionality factor n=1 Tax=Streptomyces spiralis TaxID=66376 RepID=UPI0033DB0D30
MGNDVDLERSPASLGTDLALVPEGAPVGRFHVARQRGGSPVALSAWRVTTDDRVLADTLAGLYGGVPEASGPADGRGYEVLTRRDAICISMHGARSLTLRMVLRGAGETFHVCDGVKLLEPLGASDEPCGCGPTLAERKAAARAGHGPKPEVYLRFRLNDLPEAGTFQLVSTSWEFAKSLPSLEHALSEVGDPALCVLRYELVEFTTRSGIEVSYRKPVVEVVGRLASGQEHLRLAA